MHSKQGVHSSSKPASNSSKQQQQPTAAKPATAASRGVQVSRRSRVGRGGGVLLCSTHPLPALPDSASRGVHSSAKQQAASGGCTAAASQQATAATASQPASCFATACHPCVYAGRSAHGTTMRPKAFTAFAPRARPQGGMCLANNEGISQQLLKP